MQLVVHPHRHGDRTVLGVVGDLDVVGAPELRQRVIETLAGGTTRLVLDLTGVDFVDSFGLGVVVGALKRVRQHGGDLVVVCPEPRVRRVFELVDLDRILPLVVGLDEVPRRGDPSVGAGP